MEPRVNARPATHRLRVGRVALSRGARGRGRATRAAAGPAAGPAAAATLAGAVRTGAVKAWVNAWAKPRPAAAAAARVGAPTRGGFPPSHAVQPGRCSGCGGGRGGRQAVQCGRWWPWAGAATACVAGAWRRQWRREHGPVAVGVAGAATGPTHGSVHRGAAQPGGAARHHHAPHDVRSDRRGRTSDDPRGLWCRARPRRCALFHRSGWPREQRRRISLLPARGVAHVAAGGGLKLQVGLGCGDPWQLHTLALNIIFTTRWDRSGSIEPHAS